MIHETGSINLTPPPDRPRTIRKKAAVNIVKRK
ncbi:unnamed protein product, partial [Rotaria sp. Silwood1]